MRSLIALVGFLVLVELAASFGALFMPGEWYASLDKPPLTPPNWVFGPVWRLLHVAIAVSAWLVWRAGGIPVFPTRRPGDFRELPECWPLVAQPLADDATLAQRLSRGEHMVLRIVERG